MMKMSLVNTFLVVTSVPGDTETGVRIPARSLTHSARAAHERARHRAHFETPPLPHALADPARRIVHRFTCSHSETDHAAAKLVRPGPSHP
jgi:hypothetical protein